MEERVITVEGRMTAIETRMASVETKLDQLLARIPSTVSPAYSTISNNSSTGYGIPNCQINYYHPGGNHGVQLFGPPLATSMLSYGGVAETQPYNVPLGGQVTTRGHQPQQHLNSNMMSNYPQRETPRMQIYGANLIHFPDHVTATNALAAAVPTSCAPVASYGVQRNHKSYSSRAVALDATNYDAPIDIRSAQLSGPFLFPSMQNYSGVSGPQSYNVALGGQVTTQGHQPQQHLNTNIMSNYPQREMHRMQRCGTDSVHFTNHVTAANALAPAVPNSNTTVANCGVPRNHDSYSSRAVTLDATNFDTPIDIRGAQRLSPPFATSVQSYSGVSGAQLYNVPHGGQVTTQCHQSQQDLNPAMISNPQCEMSEIQMHGADSTHFDCQLSSAEALAPAIPPSSAGYSVERSLNSYNSGAGALDASGTRLHVPPSSGVLDGQQEQCYNVPFNMSMTNSAALPRNTIASSPSTIVYVPNANDNYVPARASGNVQTSGAGSAASTMNQQETEQMDYAAQRRAYYYRSFANIGQQRHIYNQNLAGLPVTSSSEGQGLSRTAEQPQYRQMEDFYQQQYP